MCVLSYSGAFIYSCWLYIAESSLKASLLFVYIKLNLLRFVSFATIQFQLRRLTVRSTIILMCMRILDVSCFRSAGRLPSTPYQPIPVYPKSSCASVTDNNQQRHVETLSTPSLGPYSPQNILDSLPPTAKRKKYTNTLSRILSFNVSTFTFNQQHVSKACHLCRSSDLLRLPISCAKFHRF